MKILNEDSLSQTINQAYHAELFQIKISKEEKEATVSWMLNRAGQPGSYSGLSAPTKSDFKLGATMFTGEKITSGAATAHILGEDALSIISRWKLADKALQRDIASLSSQWSLKMDENERQQGKPMGMFCCGKCSLAYWRGLLAGTMPRAQERLSQGLKLLQADRDGKGRWKRFPFYNTLWVLGEIPDPKAIKELHYAAPSMERFLKRTSSSDQQFDLRNRKIIEGILSQL
jgi:hypothetical protein